MRARRPGGCGRPGPGWGPAGPRGLGCGPPGRRGTRVPRRRVFVSQSVIVRPFPARREWPAASARSWGPGAARGRGVRGRCARGRSPSGRRVPPRGLASGPVSRCVSVTVRGCLPGGLSERLACAGVWGAGRWCRRLCPRCQRAPARRCPGALCSFRRRATVSRWVCVPCVGRAVCGCRLLCFLQERASRDAGGALLLRVSG